MQTNPFSYQLPTSAIRTIACTSKSANYHMAVVVFDANTAMVFTGAGVDNPMKTAGGATSAVLPAGAKHATIMFFSHPVVAISPSYTLDKSIKDLTESGHPYGYLINIVSQNVIGNEESAILITLDQ